MTDYIAVDKLKTLIDTPFDRVDGKKAMLHGQIDHVGQHVVLHLPGNLLADSPNNPINHDHWGKIKPYLDSEQVLGNWMWLGAQFDEDAKKGLPNIPARRIKLMFSTFHYLLDGDTDSGKHYQKVIDKIFEVLDLGEVMPESELLANVNQISTLATTVRRSHGKTN